MPVVTQNNMYALLSELNILATLPIHAQEFTSSTITALHSLKPTFAYHSVQVGIQLYNIDTFTGALRSNGITPDIAQIAALNHDCGKLFVFPKDIWDNLKEPSEKQIHAVQTHAPLGALKLFEQYIITRNDSYLIAGVATLYHHQWQAKSPFGTYPSPDKLEYLTKNIPKPFCELGITLSKWIAIADANDSQYRNPEQRELYLNHPLIAFTNLERLLPSLGKELSLLKENDLYLNLFTPPRAFFTHKQLTS